VKFSTTRTEKKFDSFALQITYRTPDGLMEYLSTVVINRSNLQ
jgi:hypothetical protein